ncbi:ABC transporter permease [Corynebacterium glucuronolyticum]|uniref:ABC transporter permease n=1 Tax=Corynebacterium glucuronolyticum TaxID=39791 RepID=UPI00019C1B11|nr:ABC transporter permease [Corynebacterium glucuronolyticum]EEI26973.1 efflux ABC transporter, permease protein [Corynebacterium glucuronolyticum ATCC 51867]MCT1441510.1 ABC transporter permease [Corynebacterium glucuronolyticum]QQU89205.1 ABC transporter permease [Corynebacterium glucuronolyticum]QRO82855.1 ABC transporter permease [Corynebacterium glucuronolyticum]
MNLREAIRLALTSLRANKMRSALTLLGVVIGIASVVAIMTLGHSLTAQSEKTFSDIGSSDLNVTLQQKSTDEDSDEENKDDEDSMFGPADPSNESDRISDDSIEQLRGRLGDSVDYISINAGQMWNATVTQGREREQAYVQGVNADALNMQDMKMNGGHLLSAEDISGHRNVAVIPSKLVDELFNGDLNAALGGEISVEYQGELQSFIIVGVYNSENGSSGAISFNGPPSVYIPYPVAKKMDKSVAGITNFTVRPSDNADVEGLKTRITNFFDASQDYKVKVSDNKAMLESVNKFFTAISAILSTIAGISLLVGGIGVMNIMLVSVTERTREIGVRMALGATRKDIRTQFVIESMIVCVIGGIIGLIVGGGIGMIGSKLMGQFVLPPLGGAIFALGFSLAIGLFFGYYPAGKAARLNPIEALRYE